MSNNPGTRPVPTVLSAQIVALALAASPLIYLIVIFALKTALPPEDLAGMRVATEYVKEMIAGFLCLGVIAALAALKLRSLLGAQDNGSITAKMRAVVVSMAIAEVGGVLGLVLFILTGRLMEACILLVLSLASMLLLIPSRAWLETPNEPR